MIELSVITVFCVLSFCAISWVSSQARDAMWREWLRDQEGTAPDGLDANGRLPGRKP